MMYAARKSLMFIRGDAFSKALKNSLLTVIAALFTVSWANAQEAVGDSATGKTNWVYETGNYINGSPGVSDGKAV